MKKLALVIVLVCACIQLQAQTNFVKNPSFEEFSTCPDDADQITYAKFWCNAIDTVFHAASYWASEYYNRCALGNIYTGLPSNIHFYQNSHLGDGMAGATFYFDKSPPSTVFPDYREYVQGKLFKHLESGKSYCVSFFINLAETSGYAHDKIGAYLDDGSINKLAITKATEITTLVPQIVTISKITDTANWVKIQGSFISSGNETYITIGNFAKNADVDVLPIGWSQYSYYLIDDVSVTPIDLPAYAGKDSHAEPGKKAMIGRVGDTTAQGLDCKWYRKGVLIDSGAIISVNAGVSVGKIDTYVVVQTVCGLVKTDTVTVKTVPVGFREYNKELEFAVYPNPSNGAITITTPHAVILQGSVNAVVYDLLGRIIFTKQLNFYNNEATINLNATNGVYILELTDSDGNASRQRIEIRN